MLFDGMRFNQMTAAAGGRAKHWFVNQVCGTTSPCNAAFTTAGSTGIAAATSIFLVEPNTVFEDRLSQLDVRLTKIVQVRRVRVQGMLDVYNVFNAATVLTTNGRYGGSTFLLPSVVMGGRTFKFGAQLDF